MKHKVFLSGRITGDRNYREKFNKVAAELTEKGHIVLNPATLPKGLEYADYARICNAMIEACETVVLLPDYHQSPGALLELRHAHYIGKEVELYETGKKVPRCTRPLYDEDDCNW